MFGSSYRSSGTNTRYVPCPDKTKTPKSKTAVFGGLGEVAPTLSKFDAENILLSGGVRPRLMLSSKYHVNLRADFAWGKNGAHSAWA
jgi:hypothetical protein